MIERRYMSQCGSVEYCRGWNEAVSEMENADVVEVVRCKGLLVLSQRLTYFVMMEQKRIFRRFPKESIDFTGGFVTSKYGINMGGKCELEKNCGYAEDKSVFREPNDFCSRGQALKGGAE